MSEHAAEAAPEATDAETPAETFDPDRAAAKIKKANEEARSLRARLKELEPLAAEAQRLKDAQKTEVERLAERLTAAEQQTGDLNAAINRYRVALRYGLSESDIEDLNWSGTDEEIDARVRRYVEKASAQTAPRVPDVGQGARTSPSTPLNSDRLLSSLESAIGGFHR